jgi:hypothetical protein
MSIVVLSLPETAGIGNWDADRPTGSRFAAYCDKNLGPVIAAVETLCLEPGEQRVPAGFDHPAGPCSDDPDQRAPHEYRSDRVESRLISYSTYGYQDSIGLERKAVGGEGFLSAAGSCAGLA